ncbi:hypothetical protein ROU88_03160 [Macrococcus capreoli]|uniref:hypothetical protein n=1 Tax=Macrococcus capreoli TaxID=2982690 RepID=UPI003EE7E361
MNIIVMLIIAAEILFWVFILSGLVCRYIFQKKLLGNILLSSTIAVDLFLLIATSIHLALGGKAEFAHGLAAVYIAISIMFGKQLVQWADGKFKALVLNEDPPIKYYGLDHAKQYAISFVKNIIAFCIAYGLITLMTLFTDNASSKDTLLSIINVWQVVLFIDLIITISYFIWPKKKKVVQ